MGVYVYCQSSPAYNILCHVYDATCKEGKDIRKNVEFNVLNSTIFTYLNFDQIFHHICIANHLFVFSSAYRNVPSHESE